MKKINKVILFTHEKYQKNKDILKLRQCLKRKGIANDVLIQTSSHTRALSNSKTVNTKKLDKSLLSSSCLIIVFGGDGLFLTASKIAYSYNMPILGVNFGKIGFLADVDKKDIMKKITEVLDGNYIIDKRILISSKITDINNTHYSVTSLNDVVIYNHGLVKMIQVKIYINDVMVNMQRSDGVIVATPTGSTAYSMSNGCPIVSPDASVISITPISPHTYSHRPLIVNSRDKINIEVDKKSVKNTYATFDGSSNVNIEYPQNLEIKKSSKTLSIAHPSDYNYFKILNRKLKWGSKS
tara:strand:- start:1096 stop:1983 length:888 start_codon:yes stop_codon:yes gene_type:complete